MLALKRQTYSIVHKLSALAVEMQRWNHNTSHGGTSFDIHPRDDEVNQRLGGEVQTRTIVLEFPIFHGENLACWIYKVHRFFAFHITLPQHRIRLASFHTEGKALIWF